MTTRVIQWATGAVGSAQLREVIDDPELELVGVFVFSSSKAHVDAGTIVGRPPTGVLATNDKAELMALDLNAAGEHLNAAFASEDRVVAMKAAADLFDLVDDANLYDDLGRIHTRTLMLRPFGDSMAEVIVRAVEAGEAVEDRAEAEVAGAEAEVHVLVDLDEEEGRAQQPG